MELSLIRDGKEFQNYISEDNRLTDEMETFFESLMKDEVLSLNIIFTDGTKFEDIVDLSNLEPKNFNKMTVTLK